MDGHRPPTRIFLLSHMRAYTSVLGHILGSHPEIAGYYELHRGYALPDDLDRQLAQYARHDPPKPDARYFFDKLLHNDYPLDLALPGLADAVVLATLRPPAPTLASILALFAGKPGDDPYATPAGATRYYVERVAALAAFAGRHPGRLRYFDAPLLNTDAPRLLGTLAGWLGLATPLSPHYRTFSQSGRAGAGDTSPALAAGRLLHAPQRPADARLDPALLAAAEAAYAAARERLIALAAAVALA